MMAKLMTRPEVAHEETVLPPQDSSLAQEVEDFLAEHTRSAALVADGKRVDLPDEIFRVLVRVAQAMSQGQAVTVAPVALRLTTSQAADMLGISRQTLVRLLEDGQLPYEQPRRHRLLRLSDVLSYKQRCRTETRMELAEMTRQAVEDGLYDDSYEIYEDALRAARKETM
jgi:excisionase family DNA binding protein